MTGQLYTYFLKGGPMMYPLLFFSLLALIFIIERFIVFTKAKINVNEFLTKIRKALLVNRNVKEAIKVCEQYQGPVASVMKAGLLRYGHTREDIEKTIENAALYELDRLEKRMGVLATTANVAPMLGFLGTVTGMIKSFDTLASPGSHQPGRGRGRHLRGADHHRHGSDHRDSGAARLQLVHHQDQPLRARHRDRHQHAAGDLHRDGQPAVRPGGRGSGLGRESAMAIVRGKGRKTGAEIFTASMADIVFLLIVFFVLTYNTEKDRTQVDLPETWNRSEIPKDAAVISIAPPEQGTIIRVSTGEEMSLPVSTDEEVVTFASNVVAQDPEQEVHHQGRRGSALRTGRCRARRPQAVQGEVHLPAVRSADRRGRLIRGG